MWGVTRVDEGTGVRILPVAILSGEVEKAIPESFSSDGRPHTATQFSSVASGEERETMSSSPVRNCLYDTGQETNWLSESVSVEIVCCKRSSPDEDLISITSEHLFTRPKVARRKARNEYPALGAVSDTCSGCWERIGLANAASVDVTSKLHHSE
jgi:hypothetical protein